MNQQTCYLSVAGPVRVCLRLLVQKHQLCLGRLPPYSSAFRGPVPERGNSEDRHQRRSARGCVCVFRLASAEAGPGEKRAAGTAVAVARSASDLASLPALFTLTPAAADRTLEFFTPNMRNPNTRRARHAL